MYLITHHIYAKCKNIFNSKKTESLAKRSHQLSDMYVLIQSSGSLK